jgi:hypothetical protein
MSDSSPAARSAGGVAELIADRGAAAASEEFFRSPAFIEAEGATHTLRIRAGREELLAPLIVRRIGAGSELDAISLYGYPGLAEPSGSGRTPSRYADATTTAGRALDPATIDFAPTGLVSLFLRHRLGTPPLGGASERNVVQIADPELKPKSRPSDRRQVRKNVEAGYEVKLVPGSETTPEQRAGFLDVYEQTMYRTDASQHYLFGGAYFDRVLEADRTWLALALAPGGELAAASIAVVSDGFLHYYLSGSADASLGDSPMKNVVSTLVEHSTALGLPLNLGGGISRGDALEEFKRGFANRSQPWHTSEIVCDEEKYQRLTAGREAHSFFPAYRA